MSDKAGTRIKRIAKISAVFGILIFIIVGIELFMHFSTILLGILCIIGGPILALISSYPMYVYGDLIDKVCDIEKKVDKINDMARPVGTSRTSEVEKRID